MGVKTPSYVEKEKKLKKGKKAVAERGEQAVKTLLLYFYWKGKGEMEKQCHHYTETLLLYSPHSVPGAASPGVLCEFLVTAIKQRH